MSNHFPDWYDVLKGSRNLNVPQNVDERFKLKVSQFTKETLQHQEIPEDTVSSDDSDMEVIVSNIAKMTNTVPVPSEPISKTDQSLSNRSKSPLKTNSASQLKPASPEPVTRTAPQKPPPSPKKHQAPRLSIFTPGYSTKTSSTTDGASSSSATS